MIPCINYGSVCGYFYLLSVYVWLVFFKYVFLWYVLLFFFNKNKTSYIAVATIPQIKVLYLLLCLQLFWSIFPSFLYFYWTFFVAFWNTCHFYLIISIFFFLTLRHHSLLLLSSAFFLSLSFGLVVPFLHCLYFVNFFGLCFCFSFLFSVWPARGDPVVGLTDFLPPLVSNQSDTNKTKTHGGANWELNLKSVVLPWTCFRVMQAPHIVYCFVVHLMTCLTYLD